MTGAGTRHPQHDPKRWLQENTGSVAQVARRVALSRGLQHDASKALESAVFERLAADDYRVLRHYRGEAGITTYLAVVTARVLADQRPRSAGGRA